MHTHAYFNYSDELAEYCFKHLKDQYSVIGEHPPAPTHIRVNMNNDFLLCASKNKLVGRFQRPGLPDEVFYSLMLLDSKEARLDLINHYYNNM